MSSIEICYILFGAISAAFAFTVVLTGLIFPSIMLTKYNLFSNIIFIISLCDMIAGIGYSFGYPDDGTSLCSIQSFICLFFVPSSWLWTLALVYQLRCMIIYKKVFIKIHHLHMICWSISILIALLPLSTSSYGLNDYLSGDITCFLKGHNHIYWLVGLYFPILLISITSMITCIISIWYYIKSNATIDNDLKREKVLFQSLYWYPIALIVFWIADVIVVWFFITNVSKNILVLEVSVLITTQYGTICAIIFFTGSKLVRQKWYEVVFKPIINRNISTESSTVDNRTISKDSIITNPIRISFISDILGIEGTNIQMDNNKIIDLIPVSRFSEPLNYEINTTTNNKLHNHSIIEI